MASQPDSVEKHVLLQQIYIKSLAFSSPSAPGVFASPIDSKIDLNVQSETREIATDTVEVTLTVTVKSMAGDDRVFSIELAQAGIFIIRGYTPEERFRQLATVCPDALYTHARAAIATAANKGGFPDLLLQPIDFHGLHEQDMMAQNTQLVR